VVLIFDRARAGFTHRPN